MEIEGLRRMIPGWRDDPRETGYQCHNNDGKTRKTIVEFGWKITKYLERNHHMLHTFDRTYNKFEMRRLLWGLKEELHHWMLLREDMTLVREKLYLETVTAERSAGVKVGPVQKTETTI